jgi:hypothetical protein
MLWMRRAAADSADLAAPAVTHREGGAGLGSGGTLWVPSPVLSPVTTDSERPRRPHGRMHLAQSADAFTPLELIPLLRSGPGTGNPLGEPSG